MAINFLNNVNFNSIQTENIVIENFGSDALAGAGVEGQLYWNTTVPGLRGYDVTAAAWIPIGTNNDILTFAGGTGGNQEVDLNAQTFTVAGTANQIVTSSAGQTLTIAFPTIVTLPTSSIVATTPTAGDDSTKIATTAFVKTAVAASDTLAEVLAIGNTTGGTDIAMSAGDDITFTATSTIIDPGGAKGTNGQYLASTGATIDWLDLPIDPNEKYTLPVTAIAGNNAEISLTGSTDGVVSTVNFIGTAGRIALTSNDQNNGSVTINFPDDVVIVDDLLVGGVIKTTGSSTTTGVNSSALSASTALALTANNAGISIGMTVEGTGIPSGVTIAVVTNASNFTLSSAITIASGITLTFTEINSFASALDMNNNKLVEVKTGTSGTDGVNLAQVQDLVAGIGLFKGGYNATTGLTTDLTPNGSLDGASNIALDSGDFFVVTTGGSAFYTTVLEVGDMIFANQTIAASSTPAITEYTVVIQDANIATAGATDALTQKGVAGFDSANFTVTASGWVQIKALSRLNGRKQTLDNGANASPVTSPVARTFLNNLTTFVINLADDSLFGTGALAEDVTVEVMQNASPFQTVYADVTRSGSASMSIIFVGDVAVDAYRVLLEYV